MLRTWQYHLTGLRDVQNMQMPQICNKTNFIAQVLKDVRDSVGLSKLVHIMNQRENVHNLKSVKIEWMFVFMTYTARWRWACWTCTPPLLCQHPSAPTPGACIRGLAPGVGRRGWAGTRPPARPPPSTVPGGGSAPRSGGWGSPRSPTRRSAAWPRWSSHSGRSPSAGTRGLGERERYRTGHNLY